MTFITAVVGIGAFVLGAMWGAWLLARRWHQRRASMWHELGLRAQDHGPLSPAETADVIEHWIGS